MIEPPNTPRNRTLIAAAVAALFLLCAALTIWFAPTPERIRTDQDDYHLVAIRTFAAQWPSPDLRDYRSATTPGYHLALAAAGSITSHDERPMRLVGALFTCALLFTFTLACTRRAGIITGLALSLPLACSPYVFQSGAWVLPDNAAWLGVLFLLLLSLRPRINLLFYLASALTLAALVFTRQLHIWAAAPILTAAWLGSRRADDSTPPILGAAELRSLTATTPVRIGSAGAAVIAAVPAVAVLFSFTRLWGGLVPPQFQTVIQGGNPATPAFILSLCAVFGLFYFPFFARHFKNLLLGRTGVVAVAAAIGLAAALIAPTTLDVPAGRWTGLWHIVGKAPVIGWGGDRTSLLILILAPIGAIFIASIASGLALRARWVFLAAIVAFTAAQSGNLMCWQRYIEPLLLMLLGLACAVLTEPPALAGGFSSSPSNAGEPTLQAGRIPSPHPLHLAGPLLLSLLLAILSCRAIYT